MMLSSKPNLDLLRLELSVKAKNGLNFIVAAVLIWLAIGFLWTLPYSIRQKCLFTFFIGPVMLPIAWLLSKAMRVSWTLPDNPLQPLGLWLNFAQLIYFPILMFVYSRYPQHFLMVYVVITGAHFFPYAWFYNTKAYAVLAVLISVGAVWLELRLPADQKYLLPLSLSAALLVLAGWLSVDYRAKKKRYTDNPEVVRAS